MMTYVQNFTNRMFCLTKIEVRNSFDIRQYGRVVRLKRLCDQGGAYNSRWIAAAERKQSMAKPHRNRRRWNQVTREIDDVFQVVFQTDSVIQELGDVIGVFIREADCSLYTGIESLVFAEWHGSNIVCKICLNQGERFAVLVRSWSKFTDKQGSVRPSGMC